MLNVFLDTNVIIDFLSNREPFCADAAIIVSLGANKKIKLSASSMSFATASYILEKTNDNQRVKTLIAEFCHYCKVCVVDADCVDFATASEFNDFEDAMQFRCAQKAKSDIILTRNIKDFSASTIPVCEPRNFLDKIV